MAVLQVDPCPAKAHARVPVNLCCHIAFGHGRRYLWHSIDLCNHLSQESPVCVDHGGMNDLEWWIRWIELVSSHNPLGLCIDLDEYSQCSQCGSGTAGVHQ